MTIIGLFYCLISFLAKIFRKNKSYLYGYQGIIGSGIKGASENTTQMRLSAELHIDHVAGCQYSMQVYAVGSSHFSEQVSLYYSI